MIRRIEHSNIQKACEFFVMTGKGQALLGMPDLETLYVLTVNCNTLGMHTQREEIHNKVETKQHNKIENKQQCINNMQEMGELVKYNIYTDSIPNSNSRDNPMVIDDNNSKINYFLPGPNKKLIRKFMQKSCNSYIDFMGIECFNCTFSLQTKPNSKLLPDPKGM